MVFDASTWSIQQHCFKMGRSKLVRLTRVSQMLLFSLVVFCYSKIYMTSDCRIHLRNAVLLFLNSYRKALELFGLQLTWRTGDFFGGKKREKMDS